MSHSDYVYLLLFKDDTSEELVVTYDTEFEAEHIASILNSLNKGYSNFSYRVISVDVNDTAALDLWDLEVDGTDTIIFQLDLDEEPRDINEEDKSDE